MTLCYAVWLLVTAASCQSMTVSIAPPSSLDITQPIRLHATVSPPGNRSVYDFAWSCIAPRPCIATETNGAVELDLSLAEHSLLPATAYTLRLTVTSLANMAVAFNDVVFTTTSPSTGGTCGVTPLSGVAGQTTYDFTCLGWSGTNVQYRFDRGVMLQAPAASDMLTTLGPELTGSTTVSVTAYIYSDGNPPATMIVNATVLPAANPTGELSQSIAALAAAVGALDPRVPALADVAIRSVYGAAFNQNFFNIGQSSLTVASTIILGNLTYWATAFPHTREATIVQALQALGDVAELPWFPNSMLDAVVQASLNVTVTALSAPFPVSQDSLLAAVRTINQVWTAAGSIDPFISRSSRFLLAALCRKYTQAAVYNEAWTGVEVLQTLFPRGVWWARCLNVPCLEASFNSGALCAAPAFVGVPVGDVNLAVVTMATSDGIPDASVSRRSTVGTRQAAARAAGDIATRVVMMPSASAGEATGSAELRSTSSTERLASKLGRIPPRSPDRFVDVAVYDNAAHSHEGDTPVGRRAGGRTMRQLLQASASTSIQSAQTVGNICEVSVYNASEFAPYEFMSISGLPTPYEIACDPRVGGTVHPLHSTRACGFYNLKDLQWETNGVTYDSATGYCQTTHFTEFAVFDIFNPPFSGFVFGLWILLATVLAGVTICITVALVFRASQPKNLLQRRQMRRLSELSYYSANTGSGTTARKPMCSVSDSARSESTNEHPSSSLSASTPSTTEPSSRTRSYSVTENPSTEQSATPSLSARTDSSLAAE